MATKMWGKHCRLATTLFSSLVLLGSTIRVFSSSLVDPSSFEVSLQETIWVGVVTLLSKNPKWKYSPNVIEVISLCTKRSFTYTTVFFFSSFFINFFCGCWWVFCSYCSLLRRFRNRWDTWFLRHLLHITNVQHFSLYDIDSLSRQMWLGTTLVFFMVLVTCIE